MQKVPKFTTFSFLILQKDMLNDVGAEEEAEETLLEDLNEGDEANEFVQLPFGQIGFQRF